MRTAGRRVAALLWLLLATRPQTLGGVQAPQRWAPCVWCVTTGLAAGALLAPGEIGRAANATGGGEQLIAYLGDAFALGIRAGLESDVLGVELVLLLGANRVEVENEFGVRFPNHGEPPVLWTGSVLFYPLFPLRHTALGRRLRPFVVAGLGGAFVSVDLDNIEGQTLYHSWQESVGGGIRFFSDHSFVELRLTRQRVHRNGPLHGFDAHAATVALGIRF